MSIKKQYLKSKPVCKVTLAIDKKNAQQASSITVAGDFNGWNETSHSMKQLKNGDFKITLELPKNKDYQFRYLVNGNAWMNDESADAFVSNRVSGEENCVLKI